MSSDGRKLSKMKKARAMEEARVDLYVELLVYRAMFGIQPPDLVKAVQHRLAQVDWSRSPEVLASCIKEGVADFQAAQAGTEQPK